MKEDLGVFTIDGIQDKADCFACKVRLCLPKDPQKSWEVGQRVPYASEMLGLEDFDNTCMDIGIEKSIRFLYS